MLSGEHSAFRCAGKRDRYVAIEHEVHNELVSLAADSQVPSGLPFSSLPFDITEALSISVEHEVHIELVTLLTDYTCRRQVCGHQLGCMRPSRLSE